MATPVVRPDSTYPIIFNPYKLDLSQFGDKTRDKITFDITNVSDQSVTLTLADRPEGMFKIELPKSIGPGKTEKALLELTDEATKQSFEKSFTVRLDDTKASRFTVPVKRDILRPAQATGSTNPAPQKVGSPPVQASPTPASAGDHTGTGATKKQTTDNKSGK